MNVYRRICQTYSKRTHDLLSPRGGILYAKLSRHNGLDVVEDIVEAVERGKWHILMLTVGDQICNTLLTS